MGQTLNIPVMLNSFQHPALARRCRSSGTLKRVQGDVAVVDRAV